MPYGDAEEFLAVRAGVGGDTAQPAFLEQDGGVVEGGDVGEVDPAIARVPPRSSAPQCDRYQVTGRHEGHRTVEGLRERIG